MIGAGEALYHGGRAGLEEGDALVPSPPHQEDGCPICVARAEGRELTVGEYRRWLRQQGPRARPVLAMLQGAPADAVVDPPSQEQAVYVTSDRGYARWYAARSRGDLYLVEPEGVMCLSAEDHFPTWTVPRARIVQVLARQVELTPAERAELMERWREADLLARRQAGLP